MYRHQSIPASAVSCEDIFDMSTAPTTPEGSLTFSPILQAMKLRDTLDVDDVSLGRPVYQQLPARVSLDTALRKTSREVKNICCVGAGYVGGPTAAVLAFQNPHINVTVVDRDPVRIAQWNSKHLPIYEPGLYPILRIARDGSRATSFANEQNYTHLENNFAYSSSATSSCESQCREVIVEVKARVPNLFFSTEVSRHISEADIVMIAVNTPTKVRGIGAGRATDVTALEAVTQEIGLHAKEGAIIVEKSTVPCRTAELIQVTLKAHRPGLHFEVLSNPEFLAAGTAVNDLLYADRVLIGSSSTPAGHAAAALLTSIYTSFIPRSKILTLNTWSSELAKLVANSMLAQRISSINSISAICEKTGADVGEVATAVGMDVRIGGKYLKAGIGFGGSCFKKDINSLCYIADSLNLPEVADYWQQVLTMNEWQRNRFASNVVRKLGGGLRGKKIAVLGYAFKKGTDDVRESPALEVLKSLLEEDARDISIFDPGCGKHIVEEDIIRSVGVEVLKENGGNVEVCEDAYKAAGGAHAVLIMTDCDEFKTSAAQAIGSKHTSGTKIALKDPRPFGRLEPTESDLLALQQYLSASSADIDYPDDLLARFEAEPECPEECQKCAKSSIGSTTVVLQKGREAERLDWAKIAYHLEKPKWVFDGRGVVDIKVMVGLGIRCEGIGRVGWGGL